MALKQLFIQRNPLMKLTKGLIWKIQVKEVSCISTTAVQRSNTDTYFGKPVFIKANKYLNNIAISDTDGSYAYGHILHHAHKLAAEMEKLLNKNLPNERVCFLCNNDVSYVITQWAIWLKDCIAVPLCTTHPQSELEYFIEDCQSRLLIYSNNLEHEAQLLTDKLQIPSLKVTENIKEPVPESVYTNTLEENKMYPKGNGNEYEKQDAMIIYTSGTTGKPKGVVHTHGSLDKQVQGMIEAWKWSENDVVLHVLPLHHVHGIVNVLMTPLCIGAQVVMLPKFDVVKVWSKLVDTPLPGVKPVNVFMAVPTIYAKLIEYWNTYDEHSLILTFIKAVCSTRIRLMVSGSSALPEPVMLAWEELTGHTLLERYGMTEIGMALTNPLDGQRIPGTVGKPFPNVEVAIARRNVSAKNGFDIMVEGDSVVSENWTDGDQGELLVKGPNMFKEYWNKQKETKESFTNDGWFKTGDTASYEDGVYSIKGRTSLDIIKNGGFKVSALDVERELLLHPDITDVAVVGLPDVTWGQRIAAVVVLYPKKELTLDELREYCQDKLAPYQTPAVLKVLNAMPRNVMGKVNKKELLMNEFKKEMRMG